MVLKILDMFNTDIISNLPKTDFLVHSASIRRADRSQKEMSIRDFADASVCIIYLLVSRSFLRNLRVPTS